MDAAGAVDAGVVDAGVVVAGAVVAGAVVAGAADAGAPVAAAAAGGWAADFDVSCANPEATKMQPSRAIMNVDFGMIKVPGIFDIVG